MLTILAAAVCLLRLSQRTEPRTIYPWMADSSSGLPSSRTFKPCSVSLCLFILLQPCSILQQQQLMNAPLALLNFLFSEPVFFLFSSLKPADPFLVLFSETHSFSCVVIDLSAWLKHLCAKCNSSLFSFLLFTTSTQQQQHQHRLERIHLARQHRPPLAAACEPLVRRHHPSAGRMRCRR